MIKLGLMVKKLECELCVFFSRFIGSQVIKGIEGFTWPGLINLANLSAFKWKAKPSEKWKLGGL